MFEKKGKTVVNIKVGINKELVKGAAKFVEEVRKLFPDAEVNVEITSFKEWE